MNDYHSIFKGTMAEMRNLTLLLLSILLALAGCGDPLKEQISQQTPITEQRITKLGDALEQGKVRNASLIVQYANKLRKSKPELTALIDEFERDAGKQGRMYLALHDRLNTVKNQPSMFANSQAIFDELINIYQAADPILFSDALSDPLNVLADMSGGALPRVNSLSKTQSLKANNAQDFGTGEQLIGNPSYGQWSTGSNGMSFWAWYGMYSMMGDVFGSRRVNYNDWGRNRNYSYYNDYGRTRYSSPDQLRKQSQVDTRTRKSFERKGQRYSSPYSKSKVGSSSLSGQSKTAQTSAKRFNTASTNRSSYAKKSSSGKSASFRNSKNTTSRSFRRGK
jgi:hypothetical protein